MQKIPTLFMRDPENMKYVTEEVNPECQWVIDGEGVATRKYDGTCVMLDDNYDWWARREVKPGKTAPDGFQAISTDKNTGKTVGWEPIDRSPFFKFWNEALVGATTMRLPGTYELIGPKINGNPENAEKHTLIAHADAYALNMPYILRPENFRDFRTLVLGRARHDHWEGIVWHHPDGRMAKLKARDFPEGRS